MRNSRIAAVGAGLIVGAIVLAGCTPDAGPGSKPNPGSEPVTTINIAMSAASSDIAHRVAVAKGLFEKEGVIVKLQENLGTNVPTIVASKQPDLAMYSIGGAVALAQQGLDISIIYSEASGSLSASVMVAHGSKVTDIHDLKTIPNCKIATYAAGTAAYGNAVRYNDEFDLGCEVLSLSDVGAQVGAVVAGNAHAVVGTITNFASAINESKLEVLVDTTDAEARAKFLPKNYPLVIVFGLKEKVDAIPESAMNAYFRALDAAAKIVESSTTAELAALVKDSEAYESMTLEQIEASIGSYTPHFLQGSSRGFITAQDWQNALDALAAYGIAGMDVTSSSLSYEGIVDMAPFERALGAR
jgi:ABC-type nitrate/sulfonate/bicarbonate transport systems, periplasmic components